MVVVLTVEVGLVMSCYDIDDGGAVDCCGVGAVDGRTD